MKRILLTVCLAATCNLEAFSWTPSWLCGTTSDATPTETAVTDTHTYADSYLAGEGAGFVRYSHSNQFAAVTNSDDNTVSVYKVDTSDGSLKVIQTAASGNGPVYLSYSPDDCFVAVANAGDIQHAIDSSLTVYKVNNVTGKWELIQKLSTANHPEIVTPLSVTYSPDGKFVAVSNSGTGQGDDTISIYEVDVVSGELSLVNAYTPAELGVSGNTTLLAYSPDGKFLACDFTDAIGLQGLVATFEVNQTIGELSTAVDTAVVGERPFGVTYSHSGELLTVVASSPASVNVFAVDVDGSLLQVSDSPFYTGVAGSEPRFLTFSQNDLLAAVTNIHTDMVTHFCVDPSTGAFSPTEMVTLPEGSMPRGIDFDPNEQFAAITLLGKDSLLLYSVDESVCQ